MIQSIQTHLQTQLGGLTPHALTERLGLSPSAENQAMLEFFCMMSPDLRKEGAQWKAVTEGKTSKVLAGLENYTQASGKRIFRAGAALKGLPVEQHPTAEELQQAISAADGRFSLLPNDMIKFNG